MDQHLPRLLAIAAGGACGAVCRYLVVLASVRGLGDRFPIGVLIANVLGCFLLGLLMHEALAGDKWFGLAGHAALTVGFLGALTTFSTFGYDTLRLLEMGRIAAAALNLLANCGLGLAACWAGSQTGKLLWPA